MERARLNGAGDRLAFEPRASTSISNRGSADPGWRAVIDSKMRAAIAVSSAKSSLQCNSDRDVDDLSRSSRTLKGGIRNCEPEQTAIPAQRDCSVRCTGRFVLCKPQQILRSAAVIYIWRLFARGLYPT